MLKTGFHISLILMVVMCLLPSCKKEEGTVAKTSPVRVSFDARLSGAFSKAGEDGDTIEIRSLDVLLFREGQDIIEQYGRADSAHLVMMVIPGVEMHCCIIANGNKDILSKIKTYSELSAQIEILSDMSEAGGTFMLGESSATFSEKNNSITVQVSRLPSKVSISGLTVSFMDTPLSACEVTLEKIYLTNVCTAVKFYGDSLWASDSPYWCNKMGLDEDLDPALKKLLVKDINKNIKSSETLTDVYEFYAMPNPYNNSYNYGNKPEWAPRNTRVVIQMKIDGDTYYYPITLVSTVVNGKDSVDRMYSNRHYVVKNAVLRDFGSLHPDLPVDRKVIRYEVVYVNYWGNTTQEEEFDLTR